MLAKTFGASVYGVDAKMITIEVNSAEGYDISDEFEELTSVCTDLWWYSIVDLEVLKNLVPDLDESAFEIVEIPSGTWELKHEYRISEFNDNTPYATLTLLK